MRRTVVMVGIGCLLFAVSIGASAASAATRPNAVTAPIRTVHVSWGTVGYRSVGHGPPLVLLIGGGPPTPSIDDWPPALIDRLALAHRVLVMDYEGIGKTTLRPGTLSIDRLADDTASFIDALRLGRVDVMGWSMGGMVAQALAIRHSRLVRRLVLCAASLGDGTAKPATVGGQPAYPAQWLFPFNSRNRARADAFEKAVHAYPHYYEGPGGVGVQEGLAIFLWLQGAVKDGHEASQITAPALVGDGSKDVLAPLPNSPKLARALPDAQLKLYGDAGHGFLVQHEADWAARVERFLD